MRTAITLKSILSVLVLASFIFLTDVSALSDEWYMKASKRKIGEIILYMGEDKKEAAFTIYQFRKAKDDFLLKVSRNTLDSKFMSPDAKVGGWLDVPVPLIFVQYIRKQHTIKYLGSDTEWDYFLLLLR